MTTREEILEEIRKLNDAIVGLETERRSATSEAMKISLGTEITAIRNQITSENNKLTALITSQQGKFHHRFPLYFPDLLDVIICPNLFDISSNPIQVRRILKVRGDVPGWNVDFYASMAAL